MSRLKLSLLAGLLAVCVIPATAAPNANVASHVTTETELEQILLNNSYGGLTSGHIAFKVDIRPNPLTVLGQHYDGYIVIQAKDDHGQYCHWFMVIDPRVVSRIDETKSGTEPGNLTVDWFLPRIYQRDNGCWNTELNDDGSILAYGLAHWRSIVVMPDLENQFNKLPFASQHPMSFPPSSLYGKVEYGADRITHIVGELKMKQLPPATVLPKLVPLPLKKN